MTNMPVNEPVIVVEDLTARFNEVTILERISLEVLRGEILCIVGGSGCGKSTLLRHMVGLLSPSEGRVCIGGIDMANADEEELRRIKKGIGVLFQSDALIGSLTLGQNVALPLSGLTGLAPETIESIVKMKLSLVNLSGYEDHYPSQLSGGMRKRGALARAMALDPQVLFFDEPTAGLDPVNAGELERLIKTINRALATTIVIVSHQVEMVLRTAHRLIMLDAGAKGIIAQGPPQELNRWTDDRIREFFFMEREEKWPTGDLFSS